MALSVRSVCDVTQVDSPIFRQYAATLDLFRNKPGTTDTPIYDIALSWFDAVDRGVYLIKRVDKLQGSAFAAGDISSSFGFKTDFMQDILNDNGMLLAGARFKPTGGIDSNMTAIA